MVDLGKRIFDARKQRGLTLDDVGQYVGVAKSTVRKWEQGTIRNMRRDKIKRLSEILDVSPAYLMGWTDDPKDYSEGSPPTTVECLSALELQLLTSFRGLNDEGQTKLIDYADDLVSSGKYIKSNPSELGQKQA